MSGFPKRNIVKWFWGPIIISFLPFVIILLIALFPEVRLLNFLDKFVGYYYLQSLFFVILIIWFYFSYDSKHRPRPLKIAFMVAVISLLSIGIFIATQSCFNVRLSMFIDSLRLNDTYRNQNYAFLEQISNFSHCLSKYEYNFTEIVCLCFGLQVHQVVSINNRIIGMLAVFYGLISVYVVYIGTRCKITSYIKKLSRYAINYISAFSIVIVLMIFALNYTRYLLPIRHVMSIFSILLCVFFLSLGFIFQKHNDCIKKEESVMGFLLQSGVAFTIGTIFGSISILFIRTLVITLPNGQDFYSLPMGSFFFSYLTIMTGAVITYLILDDNCPLLRIIQGSRLYQRFLKFLGLD